MKKILLLVLATLSFGQLTAQQHFDSKMETAKGKPVICPMSKEVHQSFNDLPQNIKDRMAAIKNTKGSKLKANIGGNTGTTINITYKDFSADAKAAFQRAIDIWSTLINSAVPIKVTATWEALGSGVLGSAAPADYFKNFPGANNNNTFYAAAMAEKIAGSNLNSINADDISCSFSSDAPWYYGTSTIVPAGKYDLTTVVLHELCHGLGFLSTADVTDSTGYYGLKATYNSKIIWDKYMTDINNVSIIDTNVYKNPSVKLKNVYSSANVFFNLPNLNGTSSSKATLYAPNPWSNGSSISHLDENTYGPGTGNALMTPYIASAEKNLYPGPIVMQMMEGMGWKGTSIVHDELKDYTTVQNVTVRARIFSDTSLVANSYKLNYYFTNSSGQSSAASVNLKNDSTNYYSYNLIIPSGTTRVDYYIEVKDGWGNKVTSPANGGFTGSNYDWQFNIGKKDTTPPVLQGFGPDMAFLGNDLVFFANTYDNFAEGIKSVSLNYSVNGGTQNTVALKKYIAGVDDAAYSQGALDKDSYFIKNPISGLKTGDQVKYQIVSIDMSGNKETLPTYYAGDSQKETPISTFYDMTITQPYTTSQSGYGTDFETNSADWATIGFSVNKPTGFASNGLHSTHPYTNGLGMLNPNSTSLSVLQSFENNQIALLRVPIVLGADTSKITFDQIVLVEPGENDSNYGDNNFFDYVVVEGSFDGAFWFPIQDGYDSRVEASWNTLFSSSMTSGTASNSKATASETNFKKQSIDIYGGGLNTSDQGKPILVRFRLYSDQWTNGWGWAIDNLYIQKNKPAILANEPIIKGLSVFPIPAIDNINVKLELDSSQIVDLDVYSLRGQNLYSVSVPSENTTLNYQIPLGSFSSGTYMLKIKEKRGVVVKKIIVVK